MYHQFITRFNILSILVIGDLMIDRYLKGSSSRLSPEGPVPVVDITDSCTSPGGGANTAANLCYLGAKVTFCSVTGDDEDGKIAAQLLEDAGIRTRIIHDPQRATIVKTRVTAGGQLLTRYDSGTETPLNADADAAFITLLQQEFPQYDALVIADYNKGLLTPAVIRALEELRRQHPVFIAVDSKHVDRFCHLQPSLVKPNYTEAMHLLQMREDADRVAQVRQCGEALHAITRATITAVTLDEEGAVIFRGPEPAYRAQALPVQHPNVVGAGDVYISAFTLASLSGADVPAAAEIAATAAAVAVSKANTACCTQSELQAYFSMQQKCITDPQQIAAISRMYKAQGKKVVFTNGCFDILHSGHVAYLNNARALGHVLIVGINNDDSIRRMKGQHRPINPLSDRMQVLAGLEAVTHIIPFGNMADDTPCELISMIAPDIFAKGGDYRLEDLPEAPLVKELGGNVTILPLVPGRSTSSVIRRIHTNPLLKTV
ncbi:D-glycero-beta-D-manno-heptose 1-phosphate adenylyltransferase [Chitinophaga cymbidii]|nr:D-glycero-beta-D-manno-heptose 1-phosphate adenylyltransferase [Chitinophaga cymbidii]